MFEIILSFLTAFALTFFAIPSIIHVAKKKNLTDEPGERRSHTESTPSLGGIGIFAGMIFSITLWAPFSTFNDLQYILCAFVIIFLIGVKDDIDPISPKKKLVGEILAAAILVFKSNVKITSFYGLFGISALPEWVAITVSIFTILVIINAFNLIDGINGLSGSISTLIALTFGSWFYLTNQSELAVVAFALAGAVVAFLRYNYTPAKIFMGDTGALLIGLVCSILAIKFMETNKLLDVGSPYRVNSVPAIAIGVLILPLFDTLRVFVTRILNGKSPLYPDRTHIHHLLLDKGLSHMKATSILVFVNAGFIALVFLLQDVGSLYLLLIVLGLAFVLSYGLYHSVQKQAKL